MKHGLTHIALKVFNPQKTADFYGKWCGMEVVHRRKSEDSDHPVLWLSSPDYKGQFAIVVLPGRTMRKDSSEDEPEHLGFSLESVENVKEIAAKAAKAGILHWDVMDLGYPVGTICAIKDPDGNVIEFSHGQPIGFEDGDEKDGEKNEPDARGKTRKSASKAPKHPKP